MARALRGARRRRLPRAAGAAASRVRSSVLLCSVSCKQGCYVDSESLLWTGRFPTLIGDVGDAGAGADWRVIVRVLEQFYEVRMQAQL